MTMFNAVHQGFSTWIDAVATSVANLLDRLRRPRLVRLVQKSPNEFEMRIETNGTASRAERFAVQGDGFNGVPASVVSAMAGSRVELVLQPDLFVFRPLELPRRATEFLQGIVRAQIDRLTPWSATTAAFGWSEPTHSGSDRVAVTLAATAQSLLEPYRDAVQILGVHSLAILTRPSEPNSTGLITVLEERHGGAIAIARIRRNLVALLLAFVIGAGALLAAATIVDASLEARRGDLSRQLAELRAGAGSAQQIVERRKRQLPAAVVVLEALSEILPDHTYVTELRIESNKVRLIGASRDAVSLIQLIERSGRFARASLFAPTTRSSSDPTERFHIEAIIQSTTAAH
jgi:general secretion pathway protein L